jgi:inosine-uridine nucleoside N-ribohydrolase
MRSANLAYEMLTANLGFVDSGGFQFWDSLTAAIFTDPSIAKYQEMKLTVVEKEGSENGRTKLASDGSTIRIAVSADRKRFERILLTVWNWNSDLNVR